MPEHIHLKRKYILIACIFHDMGRQGDDIGPVESYQKVLVTASCQGWGKRGSPVMVKEGQIWRLPQKYLFPAYRLISF